MVRYLTDSISQIHVSMPSEHIQPEVDFRKETWQLPCDGLKSHPVLPGIGTKLIVTLHWISGFVNRWVNLVRVLSQ